MSKVILVSHGQLSAGLHDTLNMFATSEDVLHFGLNKGESADDFGKRVLNELRTMDSNEEYIVLADIIGGSPLTTTLNVFNELGIKSFRVLGGMNLAMAINAVLMKDAGLDTAVSMALSESQQSVAEFKLENSEDEEI